MKFVYLCAGRPDCVLSSCPNQAWHGLTPSAIIWNTLMTAFISIDDSGVTKRRQFSNAVGCAIESDKNSEMRAEKFLCRRQEWLFTIFCFEKVVEKSNASEVR